MKRKRNTREHGDITGWTVRTVAAILFVSVVARAAVTIDVMFAYDQSAARWLAASGTDGTDLARRAVEKMNAVLPATHLDDHFSFRLAGVMTSAAEAVGTSDGDRLDNTVVSVADVSDGGAKGAWKDIQVARDAFKADIVVVLIDSGVLEKASFVDGVSWSMGKTMLPNLSRFASWAYSVCNVRAVDSSHVVMHEVGHLMGAGHSDVLDEEPGPQLYSYSSAYHFLDGKGVRRYTLMGYVDMTSSDNGYELYPAFSSAEFTTPEGDPLGDAAHDNTRTLRETCVVVSRFRLSGNEGTDLLMKFAARVVASCKVIDPDGGTIGLVQITVEKTDKKGASKVSAVFYDLDGKKKTAKAVKAAVSSAGGIAAVKDVALVVKGEVTPLVVTVTADGSVGGTFGACSVERAESLAVLAPSAHFRVAGMPAAIDGMKVINNVECDGRTYRLLPDGEGVGFSADGTKWSFAKVAGVKYAKNKVTGRKELLVDVGKDGSKTNLCGLKLSVNAKTGIFTGSFTVYVEAGTPEMPKLKKVKFKVSGVAVDGIGVGRASCKGVTVSVLL